MLLSQWGMTGSIPRPLGETVLGQPVHSFGSPRDGPLEAGGVTTPTRFLPGWRGSTPFILLPVSWDVHVL